MTHLRPYQQQSIDALWAWFDYHAGNPVLNLPTGCHERGHKVVMFDGTLRAVEEIKTGDMLLGPDGLPRSVINTHHGFDEMLLVTPTKGEPFRVNKDHIFSIYITPSKAGETPSYINITFEQMRLSGKWFNHRAKLWRTSAVEFSNTHDMLPVDPWLLGVLLGDGSIKLGTPTICNVDDDVINNVKAEVEKIGCKIHVMKKTQKKPADTYSIVDPKSNRSHKNNLTKKLMDVGVWGCVSNTKHVPQIYKSSSIKNRLEIIAGLLDTDGYLNKNHYDWISKSEQLADDMVFLCRSVGLAAYKKECIKSCQGGFSGTYYRISISGNLSTIPNRLSRRMGHKRLQKKNHLVSGFTIEKDCSDEFFGLEVDGDHLYVDGSFTVHHNSGKSHIIAGICQRAFSDYPDARILMLTHVKELIEQNANKLRAHWPDAPLGIYSAGLGVKQVAPITFAGIQSIYRQPPMHTDLCIVDECHTISHKNQGIYRTYIDALLQVNPRMKVIGLTASPYRLGHGLITDKTALFDDIIEPVSIAKLQHQGYLCRLTSKATHRALSTDGVHKRGGEYIEKELQAVVDTDDNNEAVVSEMISRAHDRNSWLIFCTGINHAVRIQTLLRHHGINAETVNAGTPSDERDRILKQFRTGEIQAVTNVGVLTTGFDAPNIDMIAMLRPTMSPGLYLQMVGRGLRIHPDKENCLILDFAGNVAQHGTIHNIQPPSKAGEGGVPPCKVCDECMEIVHAAVKVCPVCGFNFPPPKPKKLYLREDDIDGTGDITRDVGMWRWDVHTARSGVDCLRCTYYSRALSESPLYEYYAVLAGGYGGMKAMEKLRAVADKTGADMMKDTLQELADELTRKRPPSQIVYRRNGKFFEIVDKLWKDEPTPVMIDDTDKEDRIWF